MSALAISFDGLDQATAEVADRLRRGVVTVQSRRGGGCGTIWNADGLIVTNNHVLPDGRDAEVVTADDRTLTANVRARDPEHDLATLEVKSGDLHPLSSADSDSVRVGELALAVGNPWGRRGTVTAGIVVSRRSDPHDAGDTSRDAIYADIRLAPGNSGGPLANSEGKVIGINAMVAGGMAVAIPSNTVTRFLAGLSEKKGFLGVTGQGIPLPQVVASNDGAALLLTDIASGSPAEAAGLLPGDILLGIEGRLGLTNLTADFRRLRPGKGVTISLMRGGVLRELTATPAVAS